MNINIFDYCLPKELIAQSPSDPRDSSRLLVLHRSSGVIEHSSVNCLGNFLRAGDLLVLNDSRVIPARLFGKPINAEGKVEFLLIRRIRPLVWQALGRPGRKLKVKERYRIGPQNMGIETRILERCNDGTFIISLSTEEHMDRWGEVPLPPYIHTRLDDPERYQTVFANELGSAAAPTAGLHFTRELMANLASQGINHAYITLHVGLDTFRPVEVEDPRNHKIHTEYFSIDGTTVSAINSTIRAGGRIVAVGTTSVRTLEQAALWSQSGKPYSLSPVSGWANLLILPGYRFRLVDAMMTNFHLPRSTTLMLTSAYAGRDCLMDAYKTAIGMGYRFCSFGDGMIII